MFHISHFTLKHIAWICDNFGCDSCTVEDLLESLANHSQWTNMFGILIHIDLFKATAAASEAGQMGSVLTFCPSQHFLAHIDISWMHLGKGWSGLLALPSDNPRKTLSTLMMAQPTSQHTHDIILPHAQRSPTSVSEPPVATKSKAMRSLWNHLQLIAFNPEQKHQLPDSEPLASHTLCFAAPA